MTLQLATAAPAFVAPAAQARFVRPPQLVIGEMEEPTYWGTRVSEDHDGATAFVREVVGGDHLSQPALGVSKQFVDRGYDSLSAKQKSVLDLQVLEAYGTKACARCSNPIPWSEMYSAHSNGGFCGWCQHQRDKMLNE